MRVRIAYVPNVICVECRYIRLHESAIVLMHEHTYAGCVEYVDLGWGVSETRWSDECVFVFLPVCVRVQYSGNTNKYIMFFYLL